MGRSQGGTSKGKQKIPIRLIEDKKRREVTFSKRRKGLFKKASELSTLCGASVAVVAFSMAGKVYAFGGQSVDAVLRRYAPLPGCDDASSSSYSAPAGRYYYSPLPGGDGPSFSSAPAGGGHEELDELRRAAERTTAELKAEEARIRDVVDKITRAKAGRQFWWEADVEALGEAELPDFAKALAKLRDSVRRSANKLRSTTPLPQQQQQQEEIPELDISDYSF